ncbi:hypothetical protein OS493_031888 [Desmophyllum pertusum]|uniref:DUF4773 domain-containing protein n=1 Tax=Desmophyllum pertusum TaxID=174260 RepID=A0A9W9Y8C9_9CNID|nr:hypothetical protein OS493_031888 [Desmophyllum pertusum]
MYLHKANLFLAGVTVILAYAASYKLNAIDSISSATSSIDGGECYNSNSTFSCCQPVSVFRFSAIVCVNVSSVDTQNVLPFTLAVDGKLDINDTFSDKKPQPSCFEYDNPGPVYLCVIFYNTTFTEAHVSSCLKLRILVQAEIFIPLKCFTLSRPSVMTETQENLVTDNIVY